MLAPPKRQSAGGSVHSEKEPAPDSAFVPLVLAQIESFHDATSRVSCLGIPFIKFFSICGNYDSVIYGWALSCFVARSNILSIAHLLRGRSRSRRLCLAS